MRERKNVYDLPSGDQTLQWYAEAVKIMKARPTTDPTSWWYQAAIHGNDPYSSYWANTKPYPSSQDQKDFWNQCQHGSWYFLPWHRMYLAFFEQIVAAAVVEAGGPAGWSLPFWDYTAYATNPENLYIPPAFTDPGNNTNDLWMPNRFNGPLEKRYLNLNALNTTVYAGDASNPEFGGPVTGFSHSGRNHGELEYIPHDMVHVMIGGAMGNPRTAALDPIFWLHHANIDRLWQVWLNKGDNRKNPLEPSWLDYPFYFHNVGRDEQTMTSREVEDTRNVLDGYVYQGVPAGLPETADAAVPEAVSFARAMPLEVIGASNTAQKLDKSAKVVGLGLTPPRRNRMRFMAASATGSSESKATYLHFENVKGKGQSPIYDVYLNKEAGGDAEDGNYAGALVLFGLESASTPSTHESGSGLHVSLNVSSLINKLRAQPGWKDDQLDVHLEPNSQFATDGEVEIGRISLYSE